MNEMPNQTDDAIENALLASEGNFRTVRMQDCEKTNADFGIIIWSPLKSIWISATTITALIVAPFTFTFGAFALFIITTAITVCFGHSLGMHRRLIHRSFECSLFFEHIACLT
jgi:sn-1 stearoyl-lipid 9-desaturase